MAYNNFLYYFPITCFYITNPSNGKKFSVYFFLHKNGSCGQFGHVPFPERSYNHSRKRSTTGMMQNNVLRCITIVCLSIIDLKEWIGFTNDCSGVLTAPNTLQVVTSIKY